MTDQNQNPATPSRAESGGLTPFDETLGSYWWKDVDRYGLLGEHKAGWKHGFETAWDAREPEIASLRAELETVRASLSELEGIDKVCDHAHATILTMDAENAALRRKLEAVRGLAEKRNNISPPVIYADELLAILDALPADPAG